MGLDMYAYRTPTKLLKQTDFESPEEANELHYWRKHPNLHGFMETLYREKGGEDEQFNCVNLLLTKKDLERLEKQIKTGKLPATTGFFFGQSQLDATEVSDDLQFVEDAKRALNEGDSVYYTSWW